MDQAIDNIFIIHEDLIRATDQAVWMNFKVRSLECSPFSVIESKSGEYAVVSDDILEFLEDCFVHPLHEDYTDFGIEHAQRIAIDPSSFRTMDANL